MDARQVRFDPPDGGADLVGTAAKARIAAILGRWAGPRRPAILFVLYGEDPFAGVYDELELLDIFPHVPIVHLEPLDRLAPGILLVFIAQERGTTAYAIADPRASN
jgi:hypothetical protein